MATRLLLGAILALNMNLAEAKTITNDRGGEVIEYALRAAKLAKSGEKVSFHGACDSACTLYLRVPNSCVGQKATFGFHLPYGVSPEGNRFAARYLMRNYPGWVLSWIRANGGLTGKIKVMPYSYIRQFLPAC